MITEFFPIVDTGEHLIGVRGDSTLGMRQSAVRTATMLPKACTQREKEE